MSVRNTEEVLSWLKDSKTRLDCDVSLLSAPDTDPAVTSSASRLRHLRRTYSMLSSSSALLSPCLPVNTSLHSSQVRHPYPTTQGCRYRCIKAIDVKVLSLIVLPYGIGHGGARFQHLGARTPPHLLPSPPSPLPSFAVPFPSPPVPFPLVPSPFCP